MVEHNGQSGTMDTVESGTMDTVVSQGQWIQ